MYNPRFNYQPIPRVTIEGKRFYATPDGNNLPSVTTILDKTKSEASKAALHNWRRAVVQKKHNRLQPKRPTVAHGCIPISKTM